MKSVSLILLLSVSVFAQTGGTFQIEKSLVAAGSGSISGGRFSLDSTAGQNLAGGGLQNSRFSLQNGFWTFNFAPTAASVSIGGRVTTFGGQGIQNVRVVLTSPNGATQSSLTGSFGNYRFNDIRVGETYVLTVFSKRFVFDNPTQIVSVNEELNNLDFTAVQP
jgi:Carboxypeptidase regulatory-like domain